MEEKTHTQSLLHVGNRKIHFLPPHDPPTSVAEARCQISLQSSFCVVTTNVREMSCHPQNSELACSTPRSHFLLSLVRLFHCSSPSRPSLDWSVKIWLKQTRDVMRCYEKKPLQATNDVLFKTRIFPLCQCLKILIWFFCSLADAALYNLDSSKRKHQKPWKMAKQHQSWVAKYWTTFEWFSNDAKEKQHFEI